MSGSGARGGGHTMEMPDQALGFFGQAPPPPAPPGVAPAAPAVSAPVVAPADRRVPRARTESTPAQPAAPRRRRKRRARSVNDDGTGVSLPISVVNRLREFARTAGRSYTDVTLDAIEATHERLADLLTPVLPEPRTGPLFAGRAPRRASHGEGHQQVNLRFSVVDLGVIDEIWPQVKAPNRSAMLAAALDEYLP